MHSHISRFFAAVLFCSVTLPAFAQSRPANLQPLPEPPPPPPGMMDSGSFEPQVTIKQRGQDRVEEHRINGKLYMIKVTPTHGTPYYLVDPKGDGGFVREDSGVGDKPLSVPMWVIGTF